jgi:colicin import membrane protein
LTTDYEVPGSEISLQIDETNLNFKFKSDKNWVDFSPNSEFRIYINDSKHSETVKLTDANSNLKNVSINGFNELSNILIDNNVSIDLQLYIADDFILNESITVSVDEVILEVTFTVTVRTAELAVWQLILIYFLTAVVIVLISGFGAYQFHYKYPPMVRDVRKLKGRLKRGRKTKSILVDSKEKIMENIFQDQLKDSNIKSIKVKKLDQKPEKIARTEKDIKEITDKDITQKEEKPVIDKKISEKPKEKVEKVPDKKAEKKIVEKEKKIREKAEKEKIAKDKAAKKAVEKEKKSKDKVAEKEKSVMEKIAKEAAEKAKKVKKSPVKVGKKEEAKVKMSKISLPKKKDKK